jgi:hypothetical protein
MNHSSTIGVQFQIMHNNGKLHLLGDDFKIQCGRGDLNFTSHYLIEIKNGRIFEIDPENEVESDITKLESVCKSCLNKLGANILQK